MVKMGEHPFKFMYKRKDLTYPKKKKNTHTHTHNYTQPCISNEKYSREKTESREYSLNVASPQNESNLAK